jgi:AcrR family transcriptional regulator
MKRLPRQSLHRIPTQERSAALVHAILDAGVQVLQTEGTEQFTSNRVAEVAGVSPGSLYQYFSNKDAIVAGIVERGLIDAEETLRSELRGERLHAPIEPVVEGLLRALAASLERYRPLLRELLRITPASPETGMMRVLETRIADLIRDWLAVQADHYRIDDAAAAIYVLTPTLVYGFLRWITDPWETIPVDRFVAAMTRVVASQVTPIVRA